MSLTLQEYDTGVRAIALDIWNQALDHFKVGGEPTKEEIIDTIFDYGYIHEAVDQDEWIIYTAFHEDVIKHSSHPDAYLDLYCNEDLGHMVSVGGIEEITLVRAFWALEHDVTQAIWDLEVE